MSSAQTAGNIKALNEYTRVNVQTGVEGASPHRLIQMLMEGALTRITIAKSSIRQNKIIEKGESIGRAISIIGGLRDSLDFDADKEIAGNLESLYEYMTARLMEANTTNDIVILDEVHGLLMQIKQAWDEIENMQIVEKAASI